MVLLKKKGKLLNPEWYILYRNKCHGYDTSRIAQGEVEQEHVERGKFDCRSHRGMEEQS
jgi:hypothetical protein